MTKDIDPRGASLALLLAAFWGGNAAAIKIGLEDAPPLRLAWMRFALGGLSILAWAWGTGRLTETRVHPSEWRPLLIVSMLFTVQMALFNIGTDRTSASHSAVLINAYAVHTVVLAHFLLPGDRLTARKLTGALLAYAGILILFVRQVGSGVTTWSGDLIVSVSAILLGGRTVYLARTVQRVDPYKLLLAQAVIGSACFVVTSSWVEAAAPYRWTTPLFISVLYQGVVVAGFNFTANLWLLKHYRPSALAGFFLTAPIFGVLLSSLFTGDPLTVDLLLASVMVAIGIGLTSRT